MTTMQEVYHRLQEWIIMLNSPDFEGTDAEMAREEMIKFCGEIWSTREVKG